MRKSPPLAGGGESVPGLNQTINPTQGDLPHERANYPTDRVAEYQRSDIATGEMADAATRILAYWTPQAVARQQESDAGQWGDMDAWMGKPKANPFDAKRQPRQWAAYEDGYDLFLNNTGDSER
ncbi:MAG: hypothetical protein KAZ26_23545 [Caldilineaceae bacterium]|nr:hypothetical protein [Caldilineaceae bacterium]